MLVLEADINAIKPTEIRKTDQKVIRNKYIRRKINGNQ
jgi:hypothetical protein